MTDEEVTAVTVALVEFWFAPRPQPMVIQDTTWRFSNRWWPAR